MKDVACNVILTELGSKIGGEIVTAGRVEYIYTFKKYLGEFVLMDAKATTPHIFEYLNNSDGAFATWGNILRGSLNSHENVTGEAKKCG